MPQCRPAVLSSCTETGGSRDLIEKRRREGCRAVRRAAAHCLVAPPACHATPMTAIVKPDAGTFGRFRTALGHSRAAAHPCCTATDSPCALLSISLLPLAAWLESPSDPA
jgi:hypothetical protein